MTMINSIGFITLNCGVCPCNPFWDSLSFFYFGKWWSTSGIGRAQWQTQSTVDVNNRGFSEELFPPCWCHPTIRVGRISPWLRIHEAAKGLERDQDSFTETPKELISSLPCQMWLDLYFDCLSLFDWWPLILILSSILVSPMFVHSQWTYFCCCCCCSTPAHCILACASRLVIWQICNSHYWPIWFTKCCVCAFIWNRIFNIGCHPIYQRANPLNQSPSHQKKG